MERMNVIAIALLVAALFTGPTGCSHFGGKQEEPLYTSGTISENVMTASAEVIALDPSTRNVALRMTDGSEVAFQVGPQVRNLDQVEVGDSVAISYLESVAYQLRKPGEAVPGTSIGEQAVRAKPGETPGAGVARTVFVTATVRAIDPKVPSATLEMASGEIRTIRVRDAARLQGVKPGDLVEFAFTQALVIGLEKLAK
jgi:Cu/Ag efflux protein CusF